MVIRSKLSCNSDEIMTNHTDPTKFKVSNSTDMRNMLKKSQTLIKWHPSHSQEVKKGIDELFIYRVWGGEGWHRKFFGQVAVQSCWQHWGVDHLQL